MKGSNLRIAVVVAALAIAVGIAACGGESREASLNAGNGGKIVSSPEKLTPQDAAAIQSFWSPGRVNSATDNPIDLPSAPKDAQPAEPQPEGGEVQVQAAAPTQEVAPAGGTGRGGGGGTPSGGGAGFQVQVPGAAASDPWRTNGKLLITFKGGQTGSCSGTLVNADNQSLVVTAGHCVYDHQHGLGWASKVVFVPGFLNGAEPYGQWPAEFVVSLDEWTSQGNFNFDLAVLSLFKSSAGVPLQAQIGARAIAFNYNPAQPLGIIGYPAVAPYNGQDLLACSTSYTASLSTGPSGPPNLQAPCDFTPGASGGGWMLGGTAGSALGSVTSTKAPGATAIDGTYFGDAALALYNREKTHQTSNAAPSAACLKFKKAQKALAAAKAKLKQKPSPAAKRAVAKAKKALKAAKKKAKNC